VLFSTLDASQAVSAEAVDSTATGVSAMTLNLATRDFSFHVNTTGVGDAVAAHIHAADAGINGPVIFPLEQSILDLNHWSTENQIFSAEQLTSFLAGDMYVNVHTPAYPLGEIRGQLTALAPGFEDTDGDGVINKDDAFPEDASESTDTDGDGVGDNADACPTDPAETQDSDGDGICDNSDPIDNSVDADGDGVNDSQDAFPNDPNESVDSDGDGVGDNGDNCPSVANPGQENSDGVGPGDACEVQSAPSFSEIQAIFNSRCVVCHGINGGLSLASNVSHNNLVNTASSQIPSLDRVVPGDSDNSYLVWKIEGRSGIVGARMPFGGPFLSQDLIVQIRAWIDAGASE
jgi:hypothetical protein